MLADFSKYASGPGKTFCPWLKPPVLLLTPPPPPPTTWPILPPLVAPTTPLTPTLPPTTLPGPPNKPPRDTNCGEPVGSGCCDSKNPGGIYV